MYASRDRPLDPRISGLDLDLSPQPEVDTFDRRDPAGRTALEAAMARDALDAGSPLVDADWISRVRVPLGTVRPGSPFGVEFGGIPRQLMARLVSGGTGEEPGARLCPAPLVLQRFFETSTARQRSVRFDGEDQVLFGDGWHDPEREGEMWFRWTAGHGGELMVPLDRPEAIRLRATLMPALDWDQTGNEVSLVVNGNRLRPVPAMAGWQQYDWHVPAQVWNAGVNQVIVDVSRVHDPATAPASHDPRVLGAAVSEVMLELLADEATPGP